MPSGPAAFPLFVDSSAFFTSFLSTLLLLELALLDQVPCHYVSLSVLVYRVSQYSCQLIYMGYGRSRGGDLSTADWGCLAGLCASRCLQAARGGRAADGPG